ncbi:hypothetical protein A2Z33_05495, partial [Candidatus Gottesmanbacteria bacterium RBG_16_52_11]
MIFINSHIQYYSNGKPGHGTGEIIAALLTENSKKFIFIKHPLFFGFNTRIETFTSGTTRVINVGVKRLPLPLRVIQEFIITAWLVVVNRPGRVYVGIDPLNASYGIILKYMNLLETVIYYTADYAEKRFQNGIVNRIYHAIDRFCLRHADQIWNVSTRITDLRLRQKVGRKKNRFLPNIPYIKSILVKGNKVRKTQIVSVSTLSTEYIDFELIFNAIRLAKKLIPALKLIVIGSGKDEMLLQRMAKDMGLEKNVVFTGGMDHDKLLEIVSRSLCGLAVYKKTNPWTWYGDSMKTREYLACGIPVLITDTCSTADEIRNMGYVIKSDATDISYKILKLYKNPALLQRVKRNALKYSEYPEAIKLLSESVIRFADN